MKQFRNWLKSKPRSPFRSFPHALRIILFLSILALLAAIVSSISHGDTSLKSNFEKFSLFTGAAAAILGAINVLSKYLDGETFTSNDRETRVTIESLQLEELSTLLKEYKTIQDAVGALDTENNVEKIKAVIKSQSDQALKESINKILDDNYTKQHASNLNLLLVSKQMDALQGGINRQIDRLTRAGTLNLIIGLFASAISVAILGYLAFNAHTIDKNNFYFIVIPRISLAIFIEIISFFFLNLYKRTLNDIKFFQNERTNIDSKAIALRAAIYTQSDAVLSKIILEYGKVERNFILKKGDSTIALEQEKIESKSQETLLNSVTKILNLAKDEAKSKAH